MNENTTEWVVRFIQGGGVVVIAFLARYYLKPVLMEIRMNKDLSDRRHKESMQAHNEISDQVDDANESITSLSKTVIEMKGDLKRGADRMTRSETDITLTSKRLDKHSEKLDNLTGDIRELKTKVES